MDLFKQYFLDEYIYIQWLPVIVGFVMWPKLERRFKLFLFVLLYSVLNEMFKIYYGTYIDFGRNRICTNIYNFIYFLTLFYLFYSEFKRRNAKLAVKGFALLYVLSIFLELVILKIDYNDESQVVSYILGGLGVIVFTFYYLLSLLNSKESSNIFRSLLFWIVIAHFFYYLGFTPFKIGENYFASFEKYHHLFVVKVYITFLKCIIISFGFIWSRQNLQS